MRRFCLDELIVLICLCVASFASANSTARAEIPPQDENAVNRQIRAKLVKRTTFDFQDATLEEVVAFLEKQHDLLVEIDYKNLCDNNYSPKRLFNGKIDDIELWTALKAILNQNQLRFYVEHGKLKIYSMNPRVSVAYPVNFLQKNQALDDVIKLMQSEIQPTTWNLNGGKGFISPTNSNKTLIIDNTIEIHEQVSAYLEELRAKKAAFEK